MPVKVLAFAASLLLISNFLAGSPQTTTTASSQQAASLLSQSAAALTGSTTVNDVTLTGTAEWIAGSDDELGSSSFKGIGGAYRLDMSFSGGTRSEIVSPVNGVPSGTWIGLDGASHAMANQNLMVDAGWFPVFAFGNLLASSNWVLTYVGRETRNGASVIHISASQQFQNLSGDSASLMKHLTQVDLYLDAATFLPASYVFNIHPDDNAGLDIPAEIRYSNYQAIEGVQIPLHVQKFISSTLFIDLQFQNASLNTGITAAQIGAQ